MTTATKTKQNAKFQELVAKLRQIFQIDRPDLDFGIYRILNARADEIDEYLETRLPEKIQEFLLNGSEAQRDQIARELKEKEAQYSADGVDPSSVPRVKELRQKLDEYSSDASDGENAVFSHLLTFFSRYYDNGDFVSQRRYKGDTYAIPYAGEEVMLHWANKDQYYTKSGEHFSNYSFKLEDGRMVHFRLVSADTAKDNRQDSDKERHFVLAKAQLLTRLGEDGVEYDMPIDPIEEISNEKGLELVVRFEYLPFSKGTKQESLIEKAVADVLANAIIKQRWVELAKHAPTEKKPQRSRLEKYLTDYTEKNKADYFVHKNLGRFLNRELDFYIKNEVLFLDDIQHAGAFSDIEKSLHCIQCLRAIGMEVISFLAQIEDFQRRLWLKKKFVVSSHYCITLDRIPEEFYSEIAKSTKQWEQWHQLGIWDNPGPGTTEDLSAGPYRMVDTSLHTSELEEKIISKIDALDDRTAGLLINGDNFQALGFLQERYRSGIECLYADPPYNAKSSEIIYKNNFKHSSWITLMYDRVKLASNLKSKGGAVITAIDENEMTNLSQMLGDLFVGWEKDCISIVHNPAGVQGDNFSYSHEYAIFCYEKKKGVIGKTKRDSNSEEAFRDWGGTSARSLAKSCFYPIIVENGTIIGFGEVCEDDFHPGDSNIWHGNKVYIYPVAEDGEERKWVFSRNSVESIVSELSVKERKGVFSITRTKSLTSYKTVWAGNKYYANIYGSKLLNNILGEKKFDFPKSLYTVKDCLYAVQSFRLKESCVLDYFSGSGTTAHAVIDINREDGGFRKFILVEMGAHLDAVIVPRIQKIVYSADWKNGEPTSPGTGISHAFKVLKLESYEDTLNNLQLRRDAKQRQTLSLLDQQAKDDYLLHYMLDAESRSSLLSVETFEKPFDCSMNIATDSAGAYAQTKVNLVETFNYLIGLRVKHLDSHSERGFVTVTGTLPSGESCLVLWRDCDLLDYEGVSRLCEKLAINPADNEFDVVYINGDHNIPTVLTQTGEEGGATRVLKLRQIEPEFLERMFSVEDV